METDNATTPAPWWSKPEPAEPELPSARATRAKADAIMAATDRLHRSDIPTWDPRHKQQTDALLAQVGELRANKAFKRLADNLERDIRDPWTRDQHASPALDKHAGKHAAYEAEQRAIAEAQRLKAANPRAAITIPNPTLKPQPALPPEVDTPARMRAYRDAIMRAVSGPTSDPAANLARASYTDKAMMARIQAEIAERGLDAGDIERAWMQAHPADIFDPPAFTSSLLGAPLTAGGQLPGADRIKGPASFETWLAWAADRPELLPRLAAEWPTLLQEAAGRGWVEMDASGRAFYRHSGERVRTPSAVSMEAAVQDVEAGQDAAARHRAAMRRAVGLH